MNLTFSFLIMKNNNVISNLFQYGESLFRKKIQFMNIQIHNNFHSFLYVQSNYYNILIKNSIFHNFLDSTSKFLYSKIIYESELIQEDILFMSIYSNKGAAICFLSNSNLLITKCYFINCTVATHGGAIYSESLNFTCSKCCFNLCCQGNNQHYGSSIFSNSNGNHSSFLITCFMCPSINLNPWHDQIIFWYGNYYFNNINTSSSSSQWNAGIDHYNCLKGILSFIITTKNIAGNSIGFYYTSNEGIHSHILIINNTVTQGLIYLADTNIYLTNSFFINNIGKIAILHQGSSQFKLINCYFDSIPNDFGTGIIETINCQFSIDDKTMIPIILFNTGICNVKNNIFTNISQRKYYFHIVLIFLID